MVPKHIKPVAALDPTLPAPSPTIEYESPVVFPREHGLLNPRRSTARSTLAMATTKIPDPRARARLLDQHPRLSSNDSHG